MKEVVFIYNSQPPPNQSKFSMWKKSHRMVTKKAGKAVTENDGEWYCLEIQEKARVAQRSTGINCQRLYCCLL